MPGRQKAGRATKAARDPEKARRAKQRAELQKIGEKITLRLARISERIVAGHERAIRKIDAQLRKDVTDWTAVDGLRKELMTNLDVRNFSSEFNDRFGFPRRTAAEVSMTNAPPLLVDIPGGLAWPQPIAPETPDADAPAAGEPDVPEAGA